MWIVCSRNRPHLVERIFSKVTPTERGLIAIDDDQEALYDGVKLPANWALDVSPKNFFGPKNNDVFRRYPNEPFYGSMNDDMLPETEGWDAILSAAAGSWGAAWADDQLGKRAGCVAFGGELVRALGFLCVPGLQHFYNDDAHETIASDLRIGIFREDVIVPHLHFSNGKAEHDATYRERPSHSADKLRFDVWKANEWPAQKVKVLEAMGC